MIITAQRTKGIRVEKVMHTGSTWLHTARSPLDVTDTGVSGSAVRKKSMGAGQ